MATDDGLSLYLSRLLSREKKSSRSLLKQRETKIFLGERFRRKRKFKFILVFLALVIGHSTVALTLTMNGIYRNFCISWNTFHFLVDELRMDIIRQDTVMRKAVEVGKKIAFFVF